MPDGSWFLMETAPTARLVVPEGDKSFVALMTAMKWSSFKRGTFASLVQDIEDL
jgi:hypothetical protein